jgi:hypothetical protein
MSAVKIMDMDLSTFFVCCPYYAGISVLTFGEVGTGTRSPIGDLLPNDPSVANQYSI